MGDRPLNHVWIEHDRDVGTLLVTADVPLGARYPHHLLHRLPKALVTTAAHVYPGMRNAAMNTFWTYIWRGGRRVSAMYSWDPL